MKKSSRPPSLCAAVFTGCLWGWRIVAGSFVAALAWGCASAPPPLPPQQLPPPPGTLYEWNPYGLIGKPSIIIDLRTQRAEIYIGGEHAGWSVVATGKEGFNTPAGDYTILEKVVDKRSTIYGKTVDAYGSTVNADADARRDSPPEGGRFVFAPMPYWMRLTWRGIGMHGGPIPRPGRPASHGCIRLPREFAPQLFEFVRIGTPVRIIR